MKKLLSVLLASATALSVCGGLAACGEDTSNQLRVWVPSAAVSCYTKLADEWKKENPEYKDWKIKVDPKEESDVQNDLPTKLSTGPNIYFFPSDHLRAMVKKNALQPISSTSYYNDVVANNDEDSIAGGTLRDGKLYAFPATSDNGIMLYYNNTKFTEDEVKSLKTMQNKAKEAGKKILFDAGSGFYHTSFFLGAGLSFNYTDDALEHYATDVDSEKGQAVAKAYYDYFNPTTNAGTFVAISPDSNLGTGLATGNYWAGVAGTWVYKDVEKQVTKLMGVNGMNNISITILPKFEYEYNGSTVSEYMGSFIGSKYCGVNGQASTDKINASLSLANYFTSYKGQMARFEDTTSGPSNKQAAADSKVSTHPAIVAFKQQKQTKGVAQYDQPPSLWSENFVKYILGGSFSSRDQVITGTSSAKGFNAWVQDIKDRV